MQIRVLIPDFGMGNLHSVKRSLRRMNVDAIVSSDAGEIAKADKIILPGVGHFQRAMTNLAALGMKDALHDFALVRKKPILGICLGMQLMAKHSEEGDTDGLGWFDAKVIRFSINDTLRFKVPHISWNTISAVKDNDLLQNIPPGSAFYFIHSYHLLVNNQADILAETDYETKFTSAISNDNICGVQFHPEKSFDAGKQLLQNFIAS